MVSCSPNSLKLTYKIIFGLTDIDLNVYFRLKGPENARIRGNQYKIAVNQCRLNVRINFLVSVLLSLGIVCLPAWSISNLYEPSEER